MKKLLLLSLLFLSACVTHQTAHKPEFSPIRPPVQIVEQNQSGSIYQGGYSVALYENVKARRVGDILTVNLEESTNAKKEAKTKTGRDQKLGLTNPTLFGRPITGIGGNPAVGMLNTSVTASNEFEGDGTSSQKNFLNGTITVQVVDIYSNGNLLIRGEKLLTLNQGDEFIRLQGIVRDVDISAENTISSTKIANAQIAYSGVGTLHDANQMGFLGRFFSSVLWPF